MLTETSRHRRTSTFISGCTMTTCTSIPYSPTDQNSNGVPHGGLHREALLYAAQTLSPHRPGSVQEGYIGDIVPSQSSKDSHGTHRFEELWTSTSTWPSIPRPSTPNGSASHVAADANSSISTPTSNLYDQHPHSWHNAQRLAQGNQPIVCDISPTPSTNSPTVGATYKNREAPPRPFWPAAHQPILPEQRSPYSELAVNLAFLEKLKEEEKARALAASIALSTPRNAPSPPSADVTVLPPPALSNRIARPPPADKKHSAESPILSSVSFSSRSITVAGPSPITESANGERSAVPFGSNSGTSATWNVSTGIDSVNGTGGLRNVKEPRKPSLACTFCRERKIACGRPPSNSLDPTCNQCARRSFKCEYKERIKSTSTARKTRK
ncbi:unnamed protein product [Cyclocybe aegerita]|uniref:Zn(2)-C6 fungal-type domain-containing protein n=1 Tax=Cyclocybe aegerita TaxID=1973307 RepID=A0A8S0VRG9_CYCAE|nr:unnamed protein product [Cyclocybe aegerita]